MSPCVLPKAVQQLSCLYEAVLFSLPAFFSVEFTREVTDTQMPLVAPVILPEMYKIFTMAEVGSRIAESDLGSQQPVVSAADPRPEGRSWPRAASNEPRPLPLRLGGQASWGREEGLLERQAAATGLPRPLWSRPPTCPLSRMLGNLPHCTPRALLSVLG